ncbi:VOC family protein [Persicobacter diffluens]|uniref:VOC family protein n=1 Tax=Persicobacter diffluens TaxID=981 RepID=A0AAN5AMC8_9BACT|nr:VOC family protein [Persicobacter diffluens]
MKTLGVYLTFDGQTEAALDFYNTVFGGSYLTKQTFGESPMDCKEEMKDQIMHAEIKAEGIHLMASDNMNGNPILEGGHVTLNVNFEEETEQAKVFEALSKGGKVIMPLNDTFWGAKFGMLHDKFGVKWMLHLQKEKTQP